MDNYKPCPVCGAPMHRRSKQCRRCYEGNKAVNVVRVWTEQEEAELQRIYCTSSVEQIARRFHVSPHALRSKAYEMGLSKYTEGYTLRSLADAMGCSVYAVRRWIECGWLTARRRQTQGKDNDAFYISDTAVRAFILAHPAEVHPNDDNWLLIFDLLMGGSKGIGELSNPEREAM